MFGLLLLIIVENVSTSLAQSEGSSFIKMPFVKLDGNILQATAVPNILQCCWKCDRLPECLSLNVADVPDKGGLYECQMLRTETNKYSGLLKPSQRYHHYTRFMDNCAECLNEDKWLKINTSPVCFGAMNSAYGSFYIKENGTVTTVKLVHQWGYVSCASTAPEAQSNWGCAAYSSRQDRLLTIMTNDHNKKILPQDECINDFDQLSYTLQGTTSTSPQLIFKNFTAPREVTAGQEYRIWYGHDLKDWGEANNGGLSCTDVYMYGLF